MLKEKNQMDKNTEPQEKRFLRQSACNPGKVWLQRYRLNLIFLFASQQTLSKWTNIQALCNHTWNTWNICKQHGNIWALMNDTTFSCFQQHMWVVFACETCFVGCSTCRLLYCKWFKWAVTSPRVTWVTRIQKIIFKYRKL